MYSKKTIVRKKNNTENFEISIVDLVNMLPVDGDPKLPPEDDVSA